MFGGMATRMAYALQLHRELDDPSGTRNDKKSELSFADREIRRRTMWACFLMDRFCASGTERPMFADEDFIKVQLPIKESHFQMDVPGTTEGLENRVSEAGTTDAGKAEEAKANMGVAAYMIRAVALWGRVIKYLNMGGKEREPLPCWDPKSGFMKLKHEAANFKSNFPPELQNTRQNLQIHAMEKLANQFVFLHVAANQVILFLHRFAIPLTPGARHASQIPKDFLREAGPIAMEAATQISLLLKDALEHNAVAPFISYSAFLSGTVLVWGVFSKNSSLEVTCRESLASNVKYLSKMERYWGMCPFMVKNLKDIYRQHAEAALKGPAAAATQDSPIFQYGDWFARYPNGVSKSDYEDPTRIKKEPGVDAALSQKSDAQTVEDFFTTAPAKAPTSSSSSSKSTHPKKSSRKSAKIAAAARVAHPISPPKSSQPPQPPSHPLQMDMSLPSLPLASPAQTQPPLTPFTPTHPHFDQQLHSHLFAQPVYPTHLNHHPSPLHQTPQSAFLPQLDRSLVYDAHASAYDSPATTTSNTIGSLPDGSTLPDFNTPTTTAPMWDDGTSSNLDLNPQHQQTQQQLIGHGFGLDGSAMGGYLDDMQTTAFFTPFNISPPGLGGEFVGGGGEGLGGMG